MAQTPKRTVLQRLCSLILMAAVVLPTLPLFTSAASADSIRVGLFYGSGALPTANLANEVGSGYQFGYFEDDNTFTSVGSTSEEKITMCKDANLYLSGGTYYETALASGSTLVGAYHLQLDGSYGSYDEALSAAQAYPYGFPAYVDGRYVVRFEFYSTAANATKDLGTYPGTTVVGASPTCYTVTQTATGKILFEFDGGKDRCLGVMPISRGATAQTWFKGYQYYGGFQYRRLSGNDMTVSNIVDESLYIAGVLPNEFVSSGGIESLKAGAVAIRTFARATKKHSAYGFDICNTTNCQVYRGVYSGSNASKIVDACTQTQGQCLYYDNSLIEALYFAADGGATESAQYAWGSSHPYLIGKVDPYEETISFASKSWSYIVTAAQIEAALKKMGYSCGTVTDVAVTETTPMGNANCVVVTDAKGTTFTFKNDNVRFFQTIPGITYNSRRFSITPTGSQPAPSTQSSFSVYDGTATASVSSVYAITASGTQAVSGSTSVITSSGIQKPEGGAQPPATGQAGEGWVISGGGYGHNVGMSQWGAYAMAELGYSYEEILKFYYSGVTVR